MKTFFQLREAANRTKRNPTRDFLRKYPVSDAEMAKPVKKPEKKKPEQGVAEGTGKNVVKSVKVGNFRHDLVDTGMGWQVRIYNGDELYDTGMSKNSEQKGLAALEDAVAYTEKQTRTKRQGVSEGEGKTQKYEMMMRNGQVKKFVAKDDADAKRIAAGHGAKSVIKMKGNVPGDKIAEQGVAEATVDIADIEKKKNISPKDKKTLGKIHDLMARERALQQAKLVKATKAVKEDAELAEAIKKPNATTRHLRDYPVSDKDVAKPITYFSLVHKATNKVLSTHKDLESAKDEHRGMDQGERAHYRIATSTKAPKSFSMKEDFEGVTEAGPFSYGAKPPRKGSVAYNAMMKRKEQDKNRVKEIEAIGTKNHHVGVAKVTKEDIEDVTEANDDMYKYIDQSGGQVIKGKSGTYVGYTHSATKGKGANILKHHNTKKYYAAGGSSTAFTAKTTLHDTPEAAAKAYHKGNLAEASPMIKPPKNEFDKKEDAFSHAKQHGGKVMKKTFTHPTSGMKNVSYVVKKD